MNHEAVDQGIMAVKEVKILENWIEAEDEKEEKVKEPEFIEKIMRPMSNLKGGAACQCFFRHRRRYISFRNYGL